MAENQGVMTNSGKHIDEVSESQKWRKLAKFKESATKVLWFAETLDLRWNLSPQKQAMMGTSW